MRRRDLEAQGDDGQMRAAVQRARDDVHAACHQGTVVCCPNVQCVADTQTGRTEYIKDSEDGNCIHMVCWACATPFCYVCGRANGSRPGECARRPLFGGCDAHQLYIEKQPGWNRFARGGESAAVGALREFHRQRVGSFVRD